MEPLSGLRVNSHRPRFRWELATGVDGVRLEVCRDRACALHVVDVRRAGSETRLDAGLDPGVYWWRLHATRGGASDTDASPTWEFFVTDVDSPLATAWDTVVDFDGDGLADAVPATSTAHDASWSGWQQEIDYGVAPGVAPRSAVIVGGLPDGLPGPGWWCGVISATGDLDGDGYGDLLSECFYYGVNGLQPDPELSSQWLFVHHGSATGLAAPGDSSDHVFGCPSGFAMIPGGDLDGDGYADVIGERASTVGAGRCNTEGVAVILFGDRSPAPGSPVVCTGVQWHDWGGWHAMLGDFDADGVVDAAAQTLLGSKVGPLYSGVFALGARGSRSLAFSALPACGTSAYDWHRWRVDSPPIRSVTDVDGDGYSDVVLDFDAPHERWTYRGGPDGIVSSRCFIAAVP